MSQSASPLKLNSQFVGRPILLHWEGHNSSIRSAIDLWKACLISFQIDLVPLQYHIVKVSKSSRLAVIVSARSYIVDMGLLFILGVLAQVRACSKDMGNTSRNPVDVLPLGHLLIRRPARASKLISWRSNPCQVRVRLGVQEQ